MRPTSLTRAALAVAGMLVAALVLTLLVAVDPREASDDSPDDVVDLGPSLTDRGWVLGEDGAPPVGVDGMRLTDSVELGYGERAGWIRLGAGWRTGGTRWAVLWCDLPGLLDAAVQQPTLTLTLGETEVTLPCAARHGIPELAQLSPLPPVAEGETPLVEHAWAGDLPREGGATLGIYLELYGAPLRSGTPEPVPAPAAGSVGVDSTGTTVRHGGRAVHVTAVELTHESRLELWAGTPGLLPVAVDGRIVTDDGDLAHEGALAPDDTLGLEVAPDDGRGWADQDPDLRDGFWHAARAGTTRVLDLPDDVLPPEGGSRTVILSVPEATALPGAWAARVTSARPAEVVGAATPTTLPDLPDVDGFEAVAAWTLPRDGHPHELPLPDGGEGPDDPWTWTWAVTADDGGHVLATLTAGDRGRPVPSSAARASDVEAELTQALLRQRDFRARPDDELAPLAVAATPAPGQPSVEVVAWRRAGG